RTLPRVECTKCQKPFSTQWASSEEDKALARGAVTSERFELGRNFCNKLWNASRFALMNLEGYTPGAVAMSELAVEDRWILSRLSTVTAEVTEALEGYRFADAARTLYGFAWDEFCSFYLETIKGRLQEETQKPIAQRVLAAALDELLRLLHPMIPFLTEEVWQYLAEIAPERGLQQPVTAAESVMIAAWPAADAARQDAEVEERFALFQAVIGALREIRARQNIAPKQEIEFSIRGAAHAAELLGQMESSFAAMSKAKLTAAGPDVAPPSASANVSVAGIEVYVDLEDLIDVDAELAKNEKEVERLTKVIASNEAKLSNANFVERAPAEVVEKQREQLAQYKKDLATVEAALAALRARK
ncbi:MAG: class I tRNA ligase family protein, partial [Planctomycetales bacterium]|nr:class I tRNA ligase family protein [Planctomycetales bacterium]